MKPASPVDVHEVRITLRDVQPPVWRVVLVPSWLTLPKMHRLIQIVMGWQDYHLHEWQLGKLRFGTRDPEYPDRTISERTVAVADLLADEKTRWCILTTSAMDGSMT